MNTNDDDTAAKARDAFERAVDAVPVAAANRLRLARRNALARAESASMRGARWRMPLGAAAVLLLGLGWWRQSVAPAPVAPAPAVAAAAAVTAPSLPVLANQDEADLYAWLAEAPVASDERSGGAL